MLDPTAACKVTKHLTNPDTEYLLKKNSKQLAAVTFDCLIGAQK